MGMRLLGTRMRICEDLWMSVELSLRQSIDSLGMINRRNLGGK
jgi:hypothetical protein